ncbi:MAG: outer membrane beta-barrel protein, partial [Myxococcota bacterium]
MRRWVWVGAALCLGGTPAWAADDAGALVEMTALVRQLQEQVAAQQEQLEFQGEALARVQRARVAVGSGPASFFETIELDGWVAASYFYNFENPRGDSLAGANAGLIPAYPFHPDSNSISLDQLWFEIERPIDEGHRAGFRADIAYGKTAGLLSGVTPGDGLSGNDFDVYQAYVQYLAPLGGGVRFQVGKFATLIGAEVAQSPENFNITRGHVYNLFQPITHTGILVSTGRGPLSVALGLVNETRSFPAADVDLNNDKALLWSLSYGEGPLSGSFNGTYGASDSGQGEDTLAGDKELILDLILGWDPSERFSAYINADWIDSENSRPTKGLEFDGYGIAVAGRYAL